MIPEVAFARTAIGKFLNLDGRLQLIGETGGKVGSLITQFQLTKRAHITPRAHQDAPGTSLSRRDLLIIAAASQSVGAGASEAASTSSVATTDLPTEIDQYGVERLALRPEGWNTWNWKGRKVNWLSAGDKGPVVLLIHGFGASVYHWRYIVPELSKHCRVFALDCLGFGWSEKPVIDYNGYAIWRDQILDFLKEVAGGESAVLVGNSLGGYNVLAAAAADQNLVRGVVLVNAAGRFDDTPPNQPYNEDEDDQPIATDAQQDLWSGFVSQITGAVKRAVIYASFIFTKQPLRIRQVLQQVYVDTRNIDDDLVKSIELPAQDPNAPEVFYRVITANGTPMNRLLNRLQDKMPLFLLWGSLDPWCVPARATKIQEYYPSASRVDIVSGHCPHDDTPELVTGPLLDWINKLPAV